MAIGNSTTYYSKIYSAFYSVNKAVVCQSVREKKTFIFTPSNGFNIEAA